MWRERGEWPQFCSNKKKRSKKSKKERKKESEGAGMEKEKCNSPTLICFTVGYVQKSLLQDRAAAEAGLDKKHPGL